MQTIRFYVLPLEVQKSMDCQMSDDFTYITKVYCVYLSDQWTNQYTDNRLVIRGQDFSM